MYARTALDYFHEGYVMGANAVWEEAGGKSQGRPQRQPFLPVQSVHPLRVHGPSFAPEQHMEPPLAVPYPCRRQRFQSLPQRRLILRLACVAATRTRHPRHRTRPPLAHLVADPEALHHRALLDRLHQFFS